jgi:Holliday junction resolvasome RuvABC endonuclease subunit
MIALGIDPGTVKHGWVKINTSDWTVFNSGHCDWLELINKFPCVDIVLVEQIIFYHGLPGNAQVLVPAIEAIGRIKQVCNDCNIPVHSYTRSEIIQLLTGKRPSRGHKVSKTDMQKVVQKLLNLDKVIRPQHASDAACVILAHFIEDIKKAKITHDKTRTKTKKSSGRKSKNSK